jgi:hypothetical protein
VKNGASGRHRPAVDQGDLVGGRDLDELQRRHVRPLADELRVQREARRFAELRADALQRVVAVDVGDHQVVLRSAPTARHPPHPRSFTSLRALTPAVSTRPSANAKAASGDSSHRSRRKPLLASSVSTTSARELAAAFGVDRLARLERYHQIERRDRHRVRLAGAQVHLHLRRLRIVERHVFEPVGIEVGTELAIDDAQDVAIELRREARRVVVRGLQRRRRLDQIDAEQQRVAGLQARCDGAQEPLIRGRLEVADRAAEVGDQPTPADRQRRQPFLEVGHQAIHAQARVGGAKRGRALLEHAAADVDRHVHRPRLRSLEGVEEHARLARGAAAELDQMRRLDRGDDRRGDAAQQRVLGPGQIVLRQVADRIEELRAAVVVKVLRRQTLRPSRAARAGRRWRAGRAGRGASHAARCAGGGRRRLARSDWRMSCARRHRRRVSAHADGACGTRTRRRGRGCFAT